MDVYATEEQQVEAIKKWFNQYGGMISWAIIIVGFIAFGLYYWRHHQEVVREQASDHYMALLEGVEKKDKETINSKAQVLINDYTSSPYASLAGFVLAQEAVQANELNNAEQHLRWVIDHSKQENFQSIAKIRLMRLLIAENKLDEALKLYNEKTANGFLTLLAELKGDILLKQKNIEGAKEAYELAYTSAPEEGMHGPLLKMKMEELGINTEKSEPKASEKEAVKS